jgi:uncharacterized protein DUF4177
MSPPDRRRRKGGRKVKCYEYKVIDTGKQVEEELNRLGREGWRVVGVTTKKQLFIAPPAALILMRELEPAGLSEPGQPRAGEAYAAEPDRRRAV